MPCTELEWHLQLWIDARDLPDLLPALAKVTVPVVVDHMGRMEHRHGTSHPGFQALLRGVGEGRLWSKLSGTYRLGATAPDYEEAPPFHDALVAANPPILSAGPGRTVAGTRRGCSTFFASGRRPLLASFEILQHGFAHELRYFGEIAAAVTVGHCC
ncbi:MAG TPA: amidohydrolase family protein [Pseudolabrys sp.]|nr:amidohydrolase family protein [Pseudolabrys sp.]